MGSGQGGYERRIKVFVLKKIGGGGGQGECELRFEVFVKMKKKNRGWGVGLSLVDKRAGFSNPEAVGSNPGSVKKILCLFLNTLRVIWVQILPLPPPHFFNFLNIVQYLFVHCSIPYILDSHPHTHHHPLPLTLLPTNLLPIDQPLSIDHPPPPFPAGPVPPSRPRFLLHFHNNFNSSFTSTLTPDPPSPHKDDPHHLPGFSTPEVVGSYPGSVKISLFFNTLRVFWVQILHSPHPHTRTFLNFLNIVQYLFVHCTIPFILVHIPYTPYHPYPQHCFKPTPPYRSTPNPRPPIPGWT